MSPVQELPDAVDTARSAEGRTFQVSMSPQRVCPIGSLVSLTDDQGVMRLGQVETLQLLADGQMLAAGRVLGTVEPGGLDPLPCRSSDRRKWRQLTAK
jgi:hypothetical protein